MPEFGTVIIGRNEGERLVRCLEAAAREADEIVYVDSGSTDNSVANARRIGAQVVNLDMSTPFTAARARNTGFAKLATKVEHIQFLDGDCILTEGWLRIASKALDTQQKLGIVTGKFSEIDRNRTIYNQMCDFEWQRPAGKTETCGGNFMVRRDAFEAVNGFNPDAIAAEDDEFCIRIRKAGWQIRRLPDEMLRHDAAITRFGQWWRRAKRAGHGFAQVGSLHPDYFVKERRRTWLFGGILPAMALLFSIFWPWGLLAVLTLYMLSYLRTAGGLWRAGLPWREAWQHAIFLTLSKVPGVIGMLTFWWRNLMQRNMTLIEYK